MGAAGLYVEGGREGGRGEGDAQGRGGGEAGVGGDVEVGEDGVRRGGDGAGACVCAAGVCRDGVAVWPAVGLHGGRG